ncbi:MAG: rhodanese-like domain-containing protein [Ferruginibacter sp.]
MQSITARALKEKMESGEALQLIDVREPEEHAAFNIGGELIPLAEITRSAGRISNDKPVVIYCYHGIRSQLAIQRLQEKYGFTNLINLIGGTAMWEKEILTAGKG